jgi:TolA-binding protein
MLVMMVGMRGKAQGPQAGMTGASCCASPVWEDEQASASSEKDVNRLHARLSSMQAEAEALRQRIAEIESPELSTSLEKEQYPVSRRRGSSL